MKSNTRRIITALFYMMAAFTSPAQDRCGFDILHQAMLRKNSAFRERIEAQDKWLSAYISTHRTELQNLPTAALYSIPVVVHVVHTGGAIGTIYNPSDATIQNAINYLNQVYDGSLPGIEGVGDIQIQFTLAKLDPDCNITSGINRINGSVLTNYVSKGVNVDSSGGVDELQVKNLIRWDPSRYYNIWVVDKIDSKDGTSGTFYGGFAYFPGVPADYDGTVILATQMQPNRKTLPHEIGHALSIYHPFQGSSGATCPPNADCTSDGDQICDTDPITLPAGFTCRTGTNTCTGTPYSINTEHNFMNYTNCSTLFTSDQKTRMLATVASPFRNGLITSTALLTTLPVTPFTAPAAPFCAPDTDTTGTAPYGYAGVLNMNITNLNLASGPTAYDGGYLDGASHCLNLVVLRRGDSYNYTATLFGYNRGQLRIWIDYNNDGVFTDATEQIFYQPDIGPTDPLNMNVSGSFTVPVTATINSFLRMRVMDEVSTVYGSAFTITGSCYVPNYGQAEDYPVFIQPELLLPVNFEYFRATPVSREVLLEWKTSGHNNAGKFIVERAGREYQFKKIGEINIDPGLPGGTWQFTDHDPLNELAFYRIREDDLDGKYQYSKVVSVRANRELEPFIRLMRNPVGGFLELELSGEVKEMGWIRVHDLMGRMVLATPLSPGQERRIRIDLSSKNLRRGLYTIQVNAGDRLFTGKFMKE